MTPQFPSPAGRRLSRRTLLAGGLGATAATLGLAGCGPQPAVTPQPGEPGAPTVASLTATTPFYVAHRGGGGDWPEMTAFAYEQAARLPELKALEISVCRSADGVLVCSHDATTERLTGMPYVIANEPWSTLSTLKVTGAETTAPRQPAQPLTRFDDVVERYLGRFVLFVEAKVPAAAGPLMDRMVQLGQPERVVWKAPINSSDFSTAKGHGFSTWGYALDEPAHLGDNLQRYAAQAELDLLGAPQSGSDAMVGAVVAAASAHGKKTLMWPIRNVTDRARALSLGVAGMMTSNPVEVLKVPV